MVDANTNEYITTANISAKIKRRITAFLPIFAILVITAVFWWLKLTGITVTADAFCGMSEHIHGDECFTDSYTCEIPEHAHSASCYSDTSADVETFEDWEATFAEVSDSLEPADRLIRIAQTQLGYAESSLNFTVTEDMVRHGYTRYGEWYGNPYGDWSAMFTSFCLRYAGLTDVPISAGADAMRLQWMEAELYRPSSEHSPIPSDVVFLDKNGNGSADATAIVTSVSDGIIYVIEGDLEGEVREAAYPVFDPVVMGYGITSEGREVILMSASPIADTVPVGKAVTYSQSILSSGGPFILYTEGSDGSFYAIDGVGGAVKVYIASDGSITADSARDDIFWTFSYCGTYDGQPSYYIQNTATGMYLHPHADSYTGVLGAVLSGRWETALYSSGSGLKLRGARQNAYALVTSSSSFGAASNQASGSVFCFGTPLERRNVWLDGTNGGIMAYSGSLDSHYSVTEGSTMTLPETWQSPGKYEYKLRGWYDIVNGKYYAPGSTVTVTGDTVFYADWVAATYDVGQFNAQVSGTVSTSEFVTIRMFDYGALFNLYSETVSTSISSTGHTETWSLLTSGNSPYSDSATLDFIFRDWDRGSEDISYPRNHNDRNNPTSAGSVYSGIYTDKIGDLLFNPDNSFDPATGTGVIGKQFIGYGDHLFHFMDDPNDAHYGYYYYNSEWNAASYNQSDGRFYVYDYLECTSDSTARQADFLPLNSPYANTNGKNVSTYYYDGIKGEYSGTPHFMYDAKYNTNGSSTSNAGTNFWFGMSVDIGFYLPNSPGTVVDGTYGNRDVYGKEMHFQFSGDDDVWVFVDGELVLDLGGIHGIESGDINFSTGIVTVNGAESGTIYDIAPGEHTLTIYYLERGSSLSNCAIYFNLAPRFSLNLQKEDVLTRELLNGAEFSIYTDSSCTTPAQLWESEASYKAGDPSTNVFAVRDGAAFMWGFGAGNTYYIRETKPPDAAEYSTSYGIIALAFDKRGNVTYDVEILDEGDSEVSKGFTVHGFKIDEEKRQAYIVVTNAEEWVTETTSVTARKKWADGADHSGDTVTVYLSVKESDGTLRRIREAVLGEDNGWTYTWTNIPKLYEDGVTEIEYTVEEAHVPGYTATIEKVDTTVSGGTGWAEALTLADGETYILKSSLGCLAAVSNSSDSMLCFISEDKAKSSPLARWVVKLNSDGTLLLTNEAGQTLSFNYGSDPDAFFRAKTGSDTYQAMKYIESGVGIKICHHIDTQYWINERFYIGSVFNSYGGLRSTTEASALIFTPLTERTEEIVVDSDSFSYIITNSVLDSSNETSLTVSKDWDTGLAQGISYEQLEVTLKLLSNGVDTGRRVTLSLKNGWRDTFEGLPYKDGEGNVISYTVEETPILEDWLPVYSDVTESGTSPPTYDVNVTNTYRWGHGYELPSTGGIGQAPWILSGTGIMLCSLLSAYVMRRKRERRKNHTTS